MGGGVEEEKEGGGGSEKENRAQRPSPTLMPHRCLFNLSLSPQIVWFIFSIFFWGLVAYASTRFLQFFVFVSAGVITMRIRIMQRLLMDRFNVYLATKNMVIEERQYDEKNTVVLVTWEETLAARGESKRALGEGMARRGDGRPLVAQS